MLPDSNMGIICLNSLPGLENANNAKARDCMHMDLSNTPFYHQCIRQIPG